MGRGRSKNGEPKKAWEVRQEEKRKAAKNNKSSEQQDYNSNGDYIKRIDTQSLTSDIGTLPSLTGSEKQVSWAKDIRQGIFDSIDKAMLTQAEIYNRMVDGRQDLIGRGVDASRWSRITKNDYDIALKKVQNLKPAADLAKESYAILFQDLTDSGKIIKFRDYFPSGEGVIKKFKSVIDSAESKGRSVTAKGGANYLKRYMEKYDY